MLSRSVVRTGYEENETITDESFVNEFLTAIRAPSDDSTTCLNSWSLSHQCYRTNRRWWLDDESGSDPKDALLGYVDRCHLGT